MADKIRILIADNRRDTRELIKTYLEKDRFIQVIGEADNGQKALELSLVLKPDVLLIYYSMSELDGYEVTEKVTSESKDTIVIITSEKNDVNLIKKAMYCGAKEYLISPFYPEALVSTIKTLYKKEAAKRVTNNPQQNKQSTLDKENIQSKVISVFSTKGGVGKTTVAVNTAIALHKKTKDKVAVIDLDLQFGDALLMVNREPVNSIVDFIDRCDDYTVENLKMYMHDLGGVFILDSPISPEYAEYVTQDNVIQIINLLKQEFKYIIIDNSNNFDEVTLTALDVSDMILLISTMDIVSVKNVKIGLNVMNSLGYPQEKVKLIINKSNEKFGIKLKDLKFVFEKNISQIIVEDVKSAVTAINRGTPFVESFSSSKISRCIYKLVDLLRK